MVLISEEEINIIRNKADIVNIIGDYIPLNKSGNDYVGMCPFHDDHSPSMHVSPKLGIFKCFVCNTGGNVFNFVKLFENVPYPQAIKIVAQKCGIELEGSFNNEKVHKYQKEFDIMDLSLKFYQNNLATEDGKNAKEYLLNRGISDEVIKNYKFGVSFNNNQLKKFLENKNCDLEDAYNLGLLNKDGINYYDMFIDRIMIPIFNGEGQLAGYTARAYLRDEKNKYINSKETIIYRKSNILFNYYFAKDIARAEREIIIVEGNMDAISLASAGIKNVCALMGVVVSQNQITMIRKLNAKVILMLDSDNAGSDATIKVGEELYKAGLDLYVVRLSGSKDPDEYIRKNGVESLKDNIKHATKYLDYKIEYLKKDKNLDNLKELTDYIKAVIASLDNASALEQEIIVSKICNDYNVDPNIVKTSLIQNKKDLTSKKNIRPVKPKKTHYELAVEQLIYAMLLNRDYYYIYQQQLGYLNTKVENDTVALISGYLKKFNVIDIPGFLDYIREYDHVSKYVNDIITSNNEENISEAEFYGILSSVLRFMADEEVQELRVKIKEEKDVSKKVELIKKLTELKKGCGNNEGN